MGIGEGSAGGGRVWVPFPHWIIKGGAAVWLCHLSTGGAAQWDGVPPHQKPQGKSEGDRWAEFAETALKQTGPIKRENQVQGTESLFKVRYRLAKPPSTMWTGKKSLQKR